MTDKKRKTPASNYSSEVYAKMKKYQKKYGFEIGTGKISKNENFKHKKNAYKIVASIK